MSYVLSQILDFLVTPSDLIAIVGGLGLLCVWRWRRFGSTLISTSVVLLIFAGASPLGALALSSLEERFPQTSLPADVTGIVVLGGSVNPHIGEARSIPIFNDAGERLTEAMALATRYPSALVLLAGGGAAHDGEHSKTESAVSADILIAMGLAPSRIVLEEVSRNTCEDAVESKRLAAPTADDIWVLVTSASHMPRAMGCFRAAALDVIPYPVDYRTQGSRDWTRLAPSIAVGLDRADLAAHEWIGLLMYRLTGQIAEWFPAPGQS